MKIFIGRSGVNIGSFPFEDAQKFLKDGVFLPSDFGWFDGMPEWKPLPVVVKMLSKLLEGQVQKRTAVPAQKGWRGERPTPKQLNFLRKRSIPFPDNANKGAISDLIAAQPEPVRRLKAKELKFLQDQGCDLSKATMLECYARLEEMKD